MPRGRSPSLDAGEAGTTNNSTSLPPDLPPTSRHQARVHGSLDTARRTVVAHLRTGPSSEVLKLSNRIDNCCRYPTLQHDTDTDELVIYHHRCMSRICPSCGRLRTLRLYARIHHVTGLMDAPRLLTLTLRSTQTPLRDQLKRLTSAFAKLRRSKVWKAHYGGGISVIEVTYSRQTGLWHPHVHAIIDGDYVPQKRLSATWEAITGDSPIVDIRLVRSRQQACRYLCSYVSKASDPTKLPPERLHEWHAATTGSRMLNTFGFAHGAPTGTKPERLPRPVTQPLPMVCLFAAADRNITGATDLLARIYAATRPGGQPTQPDAIARYLEIHRALLTDLRAWWSANAHHWNRDIPPPPDPSAPNPPRPPPEQLHLPGALSEPPDPRPRH